MSGDQTGRHFLSERDDAGTWQKHSYAASLKIVVAIAQFLLDQNYNADTPLMILSGNSLEHAFLTLGAMHVGVAAAFAKITPDTIAKILFTSGSTGMPKGVLNTQRMLSSNQQAMAQIWPFLETTPPALVEWLPWSHTFGGNHNFNLVLRNGGTLNIDHGKPAPGLIEETVASFARKPVHHPFQRSARD